MSVRQQSVLYILIFGLLFLAKIDFFMAGHIVSHWLIPDNPICPWQMTSVFFSFFCFVQIKFLLKKESKETTTTKKEKNKKGIKFSYSFFFSWKESLKSKKPLEANLKVCERHTNKTEPFCRSPENSKLSQRAREEMLTVHNYQVQRKQHCFEETSVLTLHNTRSRQKMLEKADSKTIKKQEKGKKKKTR